MREFIVSVLNKPFESQPVTAPALLAPFVTLRALWLMREVVVKMTNAGNCPGGWGMQPSLCLLYTSPSPRDQRGSRMPSSA